MTAGKVRYAELLPHEFRKRLKEKPVAYLPLGTLEWHGEHLPLGSDGIISEGLMVACARAFGGVVMPPLHLGPDRTKLGADGTRLQGMDYDRRTVPEAPLPGSCYWVSQGVFLLLVDAVLEQLKRAGFKAVFADGHGPSRKSWVSQMEEREARFGLKLLGVTEDFRKEWKSQIDHAARNETSLVMAIRPDLVDLGKLSPDRAEWPRGVGGEDPRDATPEHGRECLEISMDLVGKMLEEAGV